MHHLKDPLRPGKRGQDKIHLLSKLVQRHGALPHIHKIGGQASQIHQPRDGEQPSCAGRHSVVCIGEGHNTWDHHSGISQRFCGRPSERLVFLPEDLQILLFMIKHLLHLLPCRHFFHEPIDICKKRLLPVIIFLAPLPVPFNKSEHDTQKQNHYERHISIKNQQHYHSTRQGQKALDHHGKAVVQRLLHGVYIIGKTAHQFSVRMRVKIFQGQCLDMGKKIPSDICHNLLGCLHHQPVIGECSQSPA